MSKIAQHENHAVPPSVASGCSGADIGDTRSAQRRAKTVEALRRLVSSADQQIAALQGYDDALASALRTVRGQINQRRIKLENR